jgi:hypothetical protein
MEIGHVVRESDAVQNTHAHSELMGRKCGARRAQKPLVYFCHGRDTRNKTEGYERQAARFLDRSAVS